MDNQNFYLKVLGAAVSVLLAAASLILDFSLKGPTAAAFVIIAIILIRSAEKNSRKTGRTDQMKAVLEAVRYGSELLLISAGLISYSSATSISVAVISFVAFSELFRNSISDVEEFFGQEVRVSLLLLSFIGFSFNQYVLFYGLLAIGLVAASDSAYMLFNSLDSSV